MTEYETAPEAPAGIIQEGKDLERAIAGRLARQASEAAQDAAQAIGEGLWDQALELLAETGRRAGDAQDRIKASR